jgi:predicted RNA polymerase sigma factor
MADFPEIERRPEDSEPVESIAAVATALTLEIDELLARFRLSEEEAGELLREILLLAIYRWDTVENRETWLLATLRRACLRRVRRRSFPSS